MWPFTSGGDKGAGPSRSKQGPARSSAPHPTDADASADQCPVDEETRRVWLSQRSEEAGRKRGDDRNAATSAAYAFLGSDHAPQGPMKTAPAPAGLSTDRVVSSIPRFSMWQGQEAGEGTNESSPAAGADTASADPTTSKNWVYPSPSQFYAAMARKNHNPQAEDMNTVVPIHNAVNERAWQHILAWEHAAGDGGQSMAQCGGPKLVSFKGRPKDVTWRAWARSLAGYQRPFDRHDWEVDRCGTRVTYVIDFYSGRAPQGSGVPAGLSFYLDVRPSPGQMEGLRMRAVKLLGLGYSQKEPTALLKAAS